MAKNSQEQPQQGVLPGERRAAIESELRTANLDQKREETLMAELAAVLQGELPPGTRVQMFRQGRWWRTVVQLPRRKERPF